MLINDEDMKDLMIRFKVLSDLHKSIRRVSDKNCKSVDVKEQRKLKSELDRLSESYEYAERSLHASLVDAGLAEERELAYYAPYVVHLNGFQDYRRNPRLPRSIKELLSGKR